MNVRSSAPGSNAVPSKRILFENHQIPVIPTLGGTFMTVTFVVAVVEAPSSSVTRRATEWRARSGPRSSNQVYVGGQPGTGGLRGSGVHADAKVGVAGTGVVLARPSKHGGCALQAGA